MSPQRHIAWTLQYLARIPEKIVIGARLNRTFRGQECLKEAEQLKKKRGVGVIFAVNHVSHFDPIIFLAGINPFSTLAPMHYMTRHGMEYRRKAKKRWLAWLYGPVFFYAWGCIPAHPGSQDYGKTLESHAKLLTAQNSLALFPEGKVLEGGEGRAPAHGGIAYLAEVTGAIIIPVHIGGMLGVTEKEFWARKRRAVVTYGTPFLLAEMGAYSADDPNRYRILAEKIMDRVYGLEEIPLHKNL